MNDHDSLIDIPRSISSPSPMNEFLTSSTLRSKLTRAEKARLAGAGFVTLLDSDGREPTLLSLDDVEAAPNVALELQDPKLNEVTLCLMGLSMEDNGQCDVSVITTHSLIYNFAANIVNISTNKVFFTFKFWTYPEVTTSPVLVYTGELPPTERSVRDRTQSNVSSKPEPPIWPGLFYLFEQDGITPACECKFSSGFFASDS